MGHFAQFGRWAFSQPKAPTLPAVDEFICPQPSSEPLFCCRFQLDKGIPFFRSEEVIAAVNGFVANADFWNRANRLASIGQKNIVGINQIRIDAGGDLFGRFTTTIVVVEQALGRNILSGKADNHAVDGGHAARFIAPSESTVCEVDVNVLRQQPGPENTNLFALRDAVGRDKGAAY